MSLNRRDFLKLSGLGGLVFSSGLTGARAFAHAGGPDEFYFVQLSDIHWGFNDLKFNADPKGTLPKAIDTVNNLSRQPDFIIFTGDLTHTTDDPVERERRLSEFKSIAKRLKNKNVRFMPGEHDASLDSGAAYQKFFGKTHYHFSHKGIEFIALDNVSDPKALLGNTQLDWFKKTLDRIDKNTPVVVFAHRPLFDLRAEWDWATPDAAMAIDYLMPYKHVTVFYGHIHQEHHHMTGHIAHHSAKSLIFPLAPPTTDGKKFKVAWNPEKPYDGLGVRDVGLTPPSQVEIVELGIFKA
jgi:hypothetical protein